MNGTAPDISHENSNAAASRPDAHRWPAPGPVDGHTARALVERGARLVDVRTPPEFAQVHAEGAVCVPVADVHLRAAELGGPETPIVLYCRTGHRSAIALQILRHMGYARVWDFGPVGAWTGAFERGR
jgi:rhodanese-related sulfurtransferase